VVLIVIAMGVGYLFARRAQQTSPMVETW
jgi:hypothetical protein